VARHLGRAFPVTVRTTLLAAHTLPPEYRGRADEYIEAIAREWLPELCAQGLVDAVDIFCENIAFSVAQPNGCSPPRARSVAAQDARRAAQQLGGTLMAARQGALSCDHLEYAGDAEAAALARAGTVAVLLPVAFYCLAPSANRGCGAARAPGGARHRQRLQSRFRARRLTAARDEHGDTAVRPDGGGRAAGRHASCGARARTARRTRRARSRPGGRLRGVNLRSIEELGYWMALTRAGPWCARQRCCDGRTRLSEALAPGRCASRPATRVRGPVSVQIDGGGTRRRARGHAVTARLAAADAPAYGINTGFGLLANTRIPAAQRTLLQRNIILSHSSGVGPLLDDAIVRLTLVLKLASLLQGFSG